jgi:hypothetical protein
LSFADGRKFPWFAEGYAKDADGQFIVVEDKSYWLTVRSTYLEVIG